MSITRPDRRVITFYSFKGGVGRSMTLANVAFRLADLYALNVVAVDWDLEAPGLHEFFGVTHEQTAQARGVLDYFGAWQQAAKKDKATPPDVTNWLLPIKEKPHAPRHGSLSLLVAGRRDSSYDERLALFSWQDLYAKHAGAAAVETLRRQLVEKADIVLIDSRTGLTDAGGICTIQIPDGVVLMTAPSKQSLEGIEQVARSIAKATIQDRVGRERARVWLSLGRVPIVEEQFLAEKWFREREKWFADRAEQGLWRPEDHPRSIQSHVIPHRARWGFEEELVTEGGGASPTDPLTNAYDQLSVTLLAWIVEAPLSSEPAHGEHADVPKGFANLLVRAIAAARASGPDHADIMSSLSTVNTLFNEGRFSDALPHAHAIRELGQKSRVRAVEGLGLWLVGMATMVQGSGTAALDVFAQAIDCFRASGHHHMAESTVQSIMEIRGALMTLYRIGIKPDHADHLTRALFSALDRTTGQLDEDAFRNALHTMKAKGILSLPSSPKKPPVRSKKPGKPRKA